MHFFDILSFDAFLVIAVVIFIIVSLFFNLLGAGFTFTIAIAALGIFHVLSPAEMISGFANEQLAIIIMLLIIGDVLKRSSIFINLFDRVFMKIGSYREFLVKMSVTVAGMSAFLNNTPLVAIMMPFVHNWGKKYNISQSKLLIPLSFAAILGGCATLIGTSTNLFVNGLVTDQHIIPGLSPLNIFDFTPVGVIMIVLGIAYMVIFSNKLLPERKDLMEDLSSNSREYIAEVRVKRDSGLHGLTVEQAEMRNLKGLFLIEILRKGASISPVTPTTKIFRNDVLIFAGETETIAEMVESSGDLLMSQAGMFDKKDYSELVEVVISHNSTLIGSTAKQINFRGKYDAAIVAIHRNGERISGKIGEVKLEAGDVLLLLVGGDFSKRVNDHKDFYVISKIKDIQNHSGYNNVVLVGGTIAVVALAALNIFSLFNGLLTLLILLSVLGIISPKAIVKSIDFNLIIVIALSLALGIAMIKTGVADHSAHLIFSLLKPMGIVGIFAGIFLLTNVLGALITNKAAVAILFPIVLSIAIELQLDPKPFILLVAFAGAASFLTPIGYQTNLMVFGPGGYKFTDFLKIGTPLTLLYMVVVVVVLIIQFDLSLY